MKQLYDLASVSLKYIAFISLLLPLSVSAVVTYEGDDGVKNKIFYKNTVDDTSGCLACHSNGLSGDDRYGAPDTDLYPTAANFDSYSETLVANPYGYAYSLAEGAVNRVVDGSMPMLKDATAPNTLVGPGLSVDERDLMTAWKNDGFVNSTAPTRQATTATVNGKYSATLRGTVNRNGWLATNVNLTNTAYKFKYRVLNTGAYVETGTWYYSNSGTTNKVSDGGLDSSVSRTLSGLSCGTSYQYYLYYAYRWFGAWYYFDDGNVVSFTTNPCPNITTTSLTPGSEGVPYSATVSSQYAGPSPSYSLLVEPDPDGLTINASTGEINWTPYDAVSNYQKTFTVIVSDGTTTDSQSLTLDVSANADPPIITQVDGSNIKPAVATFAITMPENTVKNIAFVAEDADYNSLDWTEVSSPLNGTVSILSSGTNENATITYTPDFNFYGTNSFVINVTDGNAGFDSIQIDMTVTSVDFDHDGVLNTVDNCILTVNAGQEDNDMDGEGDACDSDDDNDGMPDTFESDNALNPFVKDANDDADGDGVSNLDEYLNGTDVNVDHVPPVVTAPDDIVIVADGYLTTVDLGEATAVDVKDGVISPLADFTGPFESGRYTITWSANDATGNTGTDQQIVDVLPTVNFAQDQMGVEGGIVTIDLELSGDAAEYPVIINYVVGGDADVNDSDASSGFVQIDSGRTGSFDVEIKNDLVADAGEQILFKISSLTNAAAGEKSSYQLTIGETNVAPRVEISALQNTETRSTVYADQGVVTVASVVTDPDPADTISYDWSETDNELVLVSSGLIGSNFEFDPDTLVAGTYRLKLDVSDGLVTTSVELLLSLEDSAPSLSTADTDNDGVADDVEGVQDSDNDGISDYLDAISQSNLIQNQTGDSNNQLLIQSETGTRVVTGKYARAAGRKGASISSGDILQVTGLDELAGVSLAEITNIYDFEIHGVTEVNRSVFVVVPLQVATRPGVAAYLYDHADGWKAYSENTVNQLFTSDLNDSGYCPVVKDSIYGAALSPYEICVQLRIEDGGPNDADGVVNGVIAVTLAFASQQAEETAAPEQADIGLLDYRLLILLLGLLMLAQGWKQRNAQ